MKVLSKNACASAQSFCLRESTGFLSSPTDIGNRFSDHFSCYSSSRNAGTRDNFNESRDFLSAFTVDVTGVLEAIRKLKSKFSTRIDGIPNFNIKACFDIFASLFKHIEQISHEECFLWSVEVFKSFTHLLSC